MTVLICVCSLCDNQDQSTYDLSVGVRLRPVPELGVCLAYTPARPALHRLNVRSWLIASLCDGRCFQALREACDDALRSSGNALSDAALHDGLDQLMELGIIQRCMPPVTGQKGDD
jgi:hypothetical protein